MAKKQKTALKFPPRVARRGTKRRGYEGASKAKRLGRWRAPSDSPDQAIGRAHQTLRDRARDLRRNDAYAANGIVVIATEIVGDGISTQFRGAGQIARLEAEWKAWAETTEIDYDGRHDIYGLQNLVAESVAESGEVLVRKRINALKRFPRQYQVLEADFLDTTKLGETDGNRIVQGIEFDSQGRRVAYWLYKTHPGSYEFNSLNRDNESFRVPADEIYHIFRTDRPGQSRGITWLAPVIVKLKDFDDYEDAQLVRQKIAACFAAFVQDMSNEGGGDNFGDLGDLEDVEAGEDLGTASEKVEPGIIEELPPGKTVSFSNPPTVQNYNEYTAVVLHRIASGLGITYEALTNDFSQTTFSSGRMGWVQMRKNVKKWRQNLMYRLFLNPVADDFLAISSVLGILTEGTEYVHVPPRQEYIDPTKEIPATVDSIRAGLSTLSDEIMAQGKDPVAHLAQYKKDIDMLDKLGLKLTTDARLDISKKSHKITERDEDNVEN